MAALMTLFITLAVLHFGFYCAYIDLLDYCNCKQQQQRNGG